MVDGKLNASFIHKKPTKESGGFGKIEWTWKKAPKSNLTKKPPEFIPEAFVES